MSVNFTIHGPFDVPTKAKKIKGGKASIRQIDIYRNFWNSENFSEFANKRGCYVFANAVSKGSKPIYVGKTSNVFKNECFTPHKKVLLNDFLADALRTGLQIYFVVLENCKNCSEEIDLCETLLIQKCKRANPKLLNVRKLAEKFTIKSFHGDTSRSNGDVKSFKKCLNMK